MFNIFFKSEILVLLLLCYVMFKYRKYIFNIIYIDIYNMQKLYLNVVNRILILYILRFDIYNIYI